MSPGANKIRDSEEMGDYWQFECGKATEDRRRCTPRSFRNWLVAVAVNLGPPSFAISSVYRRQSISPLDPSYACATMGQLE